MGRCDTWLITLASSGLFCLFLIAGCQEATSQVQEENKSPVEPTAADVTQLYIVQQGDTLYGIAKSHYGDGSLWPQVKKANEDALSQTDQLSIGQPLQLPPRDALLGQTPDLEEDQVDTAELPTNHSVRAGDTLYGIAVRYYGDGEDRYIKSIIDANRESVSDVREIAIGQVLIIPALDDDGQGVDDQEGENANDAPTYNERSRIPE